MSPARPPEGARTAARQREATPVTTLMVRCDAAAPQPWRNGGGVTRELLALPAGADWRVRISIADIESDGPFSAFPEVERWFAVLEGAGVDLRVAGTAHRLRLGDAPLRFDGGAATDCRLLDGPTRDLNLMLRGATGSMRCAVDAAAWQPGAAQCGLFSRVAGRCVADGAAFELPAGTLLWFDPAPATLVFTAGQRAAAGSGWWLEAS